MAEARQQDNDDLRHRDLSRKEVSQMTAEERQELKRRLAEFVRAVRPAAPQPPARKPRVRKWDPRAQARPNGGG